MPFWMEGQSVGAEEPGGIGRQENAVKPGPMAAQESLRSSALTMVLIGPDDARRAALARALEKQQAVIAREFGAYPNINHLTKVTDLDCDVVVIDLQGDSEVGLDLVESICSQNTALTVMAYSSHGDPDLLVRCMRAGAREFLTDPISPATLAEAMIRAAARRQEYERRRKVSGKTLVFVGAKGGSGVTTLSANFAIALQKESGREVALVDLNVQLGGIGLALGLTPRFTVLDALRNAHRLDADFVASLLTQHESGVSVLPASDQFVPSAGVNERGLAKLLYILRDQFAYVVVDAGSNFGKSEDLLADLADTVFLVSQVDVASLRNTNRLIAHLDRTGESDRKVQVVLNRFDPRRMEIDEERIVKAIGRPLHWKVPNDYASAHRSLNTGVPLARENTALARVLNQIARAACGKNQDDQKKKKFGLF